MYRKVAKIKQKVPIHPVPLVVNNLYHSGNFVPVKN